MTDTVDLTQSCAKYVENHGLGFGDREILKTYRSFLAGFSYFTDRSGEKEKLLADLFNSFLPYVASMMPSVSFSVENREGKDLPALYTAALCSFSEFERNGGKDTSLFLNSLKDVLTVMNSSLVGFASDPSVYVS